MDIRENSTDIKNITIYSVDYDGTKNRRRADFEISGNTMKCTIKTRFESPNYDLYDWQFINHVSRRALEILGEY